MISCEDSGMVRENGQDFSIEATGVHGSQMLRFIEVEPHDKGAFGIVYRARLANTGEKVAIKKVLHDKRYKNRELQILKELDHGNVIKLKYYFTTRNESNVLLNLVFEYFQDNVYKIIKHYKKSDMLVPMSLVKLFMYQLFRGLAYIHSLGICHRDIKPQNLLIDSNTCILKICDFGSAKHLIKGETNVAYICARYYRAPELIFGSTNYTKSIDIWSAGCVFAEMLLGETVFISRSTVDQMVSIIKVLGTPTPQQIKEMNPVYCQFNFPEIVARPLKQVFSTNVPCEAIDLVSKLLQYKPLSRLTPLQACTHVFFDELRDPCIKFSSAKNLPPLFNFTEEELKIEPHLNSVLIPPHVCGRFSTLTENQTDASESSKAAANGNGSVQTFQSHETNSTVFTVTL